MELEAVREYINQSPFRDWYLEQTTVLKYPHLKMEIPFQGISALHQFAKQQLEDWNNYGDALPKNLDENKHFYHRFLVQIEALFSNIKTKENLVYYWDILSDFIYRNFKNELPFIANHPRTIFLFELNKNNSNEYQGAYKYFIGDSRNITNDSNVFKGFLRAYEFEKSETLTPDEFENTKIRIDDINKKTFDYIDKTEKHLSAFFEKTSDNYIKLVHDLNVWTQKSKEEFTEFDTSSQQKIKDLEEAYGEKLRLSEPIKYWKERALILKKNANRNFIILGIFLIISAASIYCLLWFTPKDMLENLFNGDKSAAIRWSIVFIIFISIVFYGIRMLMKIALSSLHLARDAEERERLTYVYLALIKDSAMDKEDRQMVMQSLFSRAETGLLKDDSGPTMPGIIIDKLK